MLKALEILASVRATLDYPDPDKLKQQLLVLKLREKVDHYFNRMALTDRNWFLDSVVVNTSSNQDTYTISAQNWGRPILCETQDLTDPQHVRRSIEIIDLQDRELRYEGPKQSSVGAGFGTKHTATSMAFYRSPSGQQPTLLITPQPSQNADYIFWFEPNRPLPVGLTGNVTFLDNFQNLLVADLSLSCLPYCGYDSVVTVDGGQFSRKRTKADSLREGIARDYQIYATTFEEYIQQDRQEKIEKKAMWGDSITAAGDMSYF